MKTLGIISEFNPFHNGHKYLLDKAKNKLGVDLSVTIMSGDFVQRGEPAIMDKYSRSKTAIESGFDLVIEMPSFLSLQAAEYFAIKSVTILDKMNIDYLVFGIENIEPSSFLKDAKTIINNQSIIYNDMKTYLEIGYSYPKAQIKALKKFVNDDFFSANNILALEYIKSIHKINSKIKPYPIKRIKTKNRDTTINDKIYASSTAIRCNLSPKIKSLMPEESYNNMINFQKKYKSFNDNIIYNIFKYKIFLEDIDTKNILGYEEGLENYLKKISNNTNSYTSFLVEAASLRYTKSRIKRFIINCLLGNSSDLNDIDINFIKVLAYNKNAIQFFGEISNKINIIINKKDLEKLDNKNLSIYTKMIDSSNLYNLGIGREMNYDFIHNNRPIKR